jgi:hypothetical protein
MAKYNVYPGSFKCHTCGMEVKTIRSYPNAKQLTWMCPDKHVSTVDLNVRKTKADYDGSK